MSKNTPPEFYQWFFENIDPVLGPASDDVIYMMVEEYVARFPNAPLPPSVQEIIGDDES